MILRAVASFIFLFLVSLISGAAAQERVSVGTLRLASNGALFLAAAQGYFKASKRATSSI